MEMPEMLQRIQQTESQDHYCVKPQNIDEYIAAQEKTVQPRLHEIRAFLRSALPDAEERISWSMPTYWKGRIERREENSIIWMMM